MKCSIWKAFIQYWVSTCFIQGPYCCEKTLWHLWQESIYSRLQFYITVHHWITSGQEITAENKSRRWCGGHGGVLLLFGYLGLQLCLLWTDILCSPLKCSPPSNNTSIYHVIHYYKWQLLTSNYCCFTELKGR